MRKASFIQKHPEHPNQTAPAGIVPAFIARVLLTTTVAAFAMVLSGLLVVVAFGPLAAISSPLAAVTANSLITVNAIPVTSFAPEQAWADEEAETESNQDSVSENNNQSAGIQQDNAETGEKTTVHPDNLINPRQLTDSSFIYDTLITDLESADSYMDKQTVQVVGEVVGDRIKAEFDDSHSWITLQATDGTYSEISVYVPRSLTAQIDTYGSYHAKGTVVQARGEFNLACHEHQGLSDIHAIDLSIISAGSDYYDKVNPFNFALGIVLAVVSLVFIYVFHRMRNNLR